MTTRFSRNEAWLEAGPFAEVMGQVGQVSSELVHSQEGDCSILPESGAGDQDTRRRSHDMGTWRGIYSPVEWLR